MSPAHTPSNGSKDQANTNEPCSNPSETSPSQATDAHNMTARFLFGEFPPEVLTDIFVAVVEREFQRRGRGRRFGALRLTWVCTQWRKIALGTPRLWSRIKLNLDFRPPVAALEYYIAKSKQAPLSLTITSRIVHPGDGPWASFLDILIPEAHRWEHVVLHVAQWNFQFCLAPIKGRLHSLKSLSLSFLNPDGRILDVYEDAPQLTMLNFSGLGRSEYIRFPWAQLRECYLYEISTALHAIRVARRLTFCRLSWIFVQYSLQPTDHIYHSNLKTLEIIPHTVSDDDPGCHHLVSLLTLPSLRTLKFAPMRQLADAALWQSFFPFLRRSAQLLTTLTLRRLPFSSAEFLKCLELLPCLISLNIKCDFEYKYSTFNNEFMHRLNADHPGCLVPRLTSLSIQGPAVFDEASVMGMVTSRRYISSPNLGKVSWLERLVLGCSSPSRTSDPLPSLHCFVLEGLKVIYKRSWGPGA